MEEERGFGEGGNGSIGIGMFFSVEANAAAASETPICVHEVIEPSDVIILPELCVKEFLLELILLS